MQSQEPRLGAGEARQLLCSPARFASLVAAGELRLADRRLGRCYRLRDGHRYRVFRETVSSLEEVPRCVFEVGFRLRVIGSAAPPHWLFQRLCLLTTPFWSGFEGFATKLWMVEPRTRSYAGIYAWATANAARAYLDVLLPVLRFVSVPGSVFSEIHPGRDLDGFLEERSRAQESPPDGV